MAEHLVNMIQKHERSREQFQRGSVQDLPFAATLGELCGSFHFHWFEFSFNRFWW